MGNFLCDCTESAPIRPQTLLGAQRLEPAKLREYATVIAVDHPDGQLSFSKLAVIGSGAYSTVFMVEQHGQQQRFAMKQISKRKLRNARLVKEILTERTIMKEFQSPFMVSLHYSFQDLSNCYFVTELATGGDLHNFLYNTQEPEKAYLFQQTREEGPSKGMMYRDLKPENIFVYDDGYVKLGDFGLACEITEGKKNLCFAGTAGYQAPEILEHKGYSREVDFWSMGVLLYEMIFQDLPFDAYQINRLRVNKSCKAFESGGSWPTDKFISEEASSLISGLLRTEPGDRLGVSDWNNIKSHPFFKEVDWQKLASKEYQSPLENITKKYPLQTSMLSEEDIETQPEGQPYQNITEFSFGNPNSI